MVRCSSLTEITTAFKSGQQVQSLDFRCRTRTKCVIFIGALTGSTVAGVTGDAGPYAYQFNSPTAVAFDIYGFMFVLDSANSRIQKWVPLASYGVTVAAASMSTPLSMKIDPRGNIVVVDSSNYRVISFGMTCRELLLLRST